MEDDGYGEPLPRSEGVNNDPLRDGIPRRWRYRYGDEERARPWLHHQAGSGDKEMRATKDRDFGSMSSSDGAVPIILDRQ